MVPGTSRLDVPRLFVCVTLRVLERSRDDIYDHDSEGQLVGHGEEPARLFAEAAASDLTPQSRGWTLVCMGPDASAAQDATLRLGVCGPEQAGFHEIWRRSHKTSRAACFVFFSLARNTSASFRTSFPRSGAVEVLWSSLCPSSFAAASPWTHPSLFQSTVARFLYILEASHSESCTTQLTLTHKVTPASASRTPATMPTTGTAQDRFPELFGQTSINPRSRKRKVEMKVLVIGMMRTGTKCKLDRPWPLRNHG